jgi:hypothetical protein
MIAYSLFLARHTQWEAGYSWGPRYLLPVVPLLLVGMAPLLRNVPRRWPRKALAVLCILGVLINLPAVFTSVFEIQSAGSYYDSNYDYLMDHNAAGQQWGLLFRYLGEAFRGQALESPLHQGLDLWFVTLLKDRVPSSLILLGVSLALAALAGGLILQPRSRSKKRGQP